MVPYDLKHLQEMLTLELAFIYMNKDFFSADTLKLGCSHGHEE